MWTFKDQLFDQTLLEFDSFVYLIERLNIREDDTSPIYYVGKKTFFSRPKHKGKRIIVESNWWDYYGSSDWLESDIGKYGKNNFKRTILHLCRTKGDAGYLEVKEQIERNVLNIEPDGYQLYYNKNILGRYRYEPEFYLVENKLKDYYNLEHIHGNNFNKKWITNSKENRCVSKKIAEELVSSSNWFYGRSEKHIPVNDGANNLLIPKSEYDKKIHTLGYLKTYITDGKNDKLLPNHEIPEFIEENKDFHIGYSKNSNDVWITNGIVDKKINLSEMDEFKDFKLGRINSGVRHKISIFKGDSIKWILKYELEKYEPLGWCRGGKPQDYNLYIVTNDINQKHFREENVMIEFLIHNPDWRKGQLHRESFNTKNKVFAKDIRTDVKLTVTREEYAANKYLTSVKTKKVKIKKKSRIIFKGYLELFLIENEQYPKLPFNNALRSPDGTINLLKGKNSWLNDEKINIRWL